MNKGGNVARDQIVKLTGDKFKHIKGSTLRRVEAWVTYRLDFQRRVRDYLRYGSTGT